MTGPVEFEEIVEQHYTPLYRFALSLTRQESDAGDLVQQTFYVWATKGHQLQDAAKVKPWLFTTLHRAFLEGQRKHRRFPHHDLEETAEELPPVDANVVDRLDAQAVLDQLRRVDEVFQAAVALFYLEDYSYKEIAEILEIPLGTVKSRIARGLSQLQTFLMQQLGHVSHSCPN